MKALFGGTFAVIALSIACAAGLWLAQIEGSCVDDAGKPLANAELQFFDKHNGHRFSVRTDAQGKFFFAGAEPGAYAVTVRRGKKLMDFPAIAIGWSAQPQQLTIDLSRQAIAIKRSVRETESYAGESSYEDPVIITVGSDPETREISGKLDQALALGGSGNWGGAIQILEGLTSGVAAKDSVVWAQLANAYFHAAESNAAREQRLEQSVEAYSKAIDLRPAGVDYNNRGEARFRLRKWDDAVADMKLAEATNPEHRAVYQKNIGVILLAKVQDGVDAASASDLQAAVVAFSHAIAAKPESPEPYYLRAYCQVRLLGLVQDAPSYDDIASGLQRYLELAPDGKHAAEARELLAGMGRK